MLSGAMLNGAFFYYYAECHYAEWSVFFIIMLNVIMRSVAMLSVVAPLNLYQVQK
jgi:hypothetical protein